MNRLPGLRSRRRTPARPRQRGIILLVVLWVMIVLALLGTSYFHLASLEIMASRNELDKFQARLLADSALQLAMAVLEEESALGYLDLNSNWSGGGEKALFEATPFGEGVFQIFTDDVLSEEGGTRFGLRDEASKVNINTADLETLQKLPGVDSEMAASIVDWRDSDETVTPGGAETEYYNNLEPSYDCANAPFESVPEILRVKGFTPKILYGEDVNRDGLLQTAENDGDENDPPDNSDSKLDRGLLPYITVLSYAKNVNANDEKRLNLNEATVPQIEERIGAKISESSLRKLKQYRKTKKFENLAQMLTGEGTDLSDAEKKTRESEEPSSVSAEGQDAKTGGRESDEEEVASATQTGAVLTQAEFELVIDDLTLKNDEYLPGLININTAPTEVLVCLPGIDTSIAQQIVERRGSELGAFQTVADLATIEGLSMESFGELIDRVTVRSYVFEALAVGYLPKRQAFASLEAKIDRGGRGPKLLDYRILR